MLSLLYCPAQGLPCLESSPTSVWHPKDYMKPQTVSTPYLVPLSDSDRIFTPGQQAQADLIKVDLLLGRAKLVGSKPAEKA